MTFTVKSVSTRLGVRPADLDSLGHVNNARVLEYLETSRWHWLDANGLAGRRRVVPVVSRVRIDYLRQIPVCELRVDTSLELPVDEDLEFTFRVRFQQVVAEPGRAGSAFARAELEVAFVELGSGRLSSVAEFLGSSHEHDLAPSPPPLHQPTVSADAT